MRLPVASTINAVPQCVPMGMIGLGLSGAAIFNAFDLARRVAPAYEIQSTCNGHPEIGGPYHHHDCLPCLQNGERGSDQSGHAHEAALDGKRADRYHYHFTNEIPYIVARFKGMVDAKHWKR
jgi:hypothetical protein